MARIAAAKRADGRFEAEGVIFDPPISAWGSIGFPTTDTVLAAACINALPIPRRSLLMKRLFLKACDVCGGFYLDGRSDNWRAYRAKAPLFPVFRWPAPPLRAAFAHRATAGPDRLRQLRRAPDRAVGSEVLLSQMPGSGSPRPLGAR